MAVTLHVCPRHLPLTWEDFCATRPPFSIALDGYVGAGPRYDDSGPRLNLNHHEEVDRLATRATCGQVLMVLRQGLAERFCDDSGGFRAEVYVNDCDEDVCLSWFLLHHGYLAEHVINPVLNRLVGMVDALDTTAGAYPYPVEMPILTELAWIFQPYRQFRAAGGLDSRSPEDYTQVIESVEHRILAHLLGNGGQLPLDTHYDSIGGGEGWRLIRELGAQARTGVFADGIRAYVAVRTRPDGRWTYTVGRMSPFIPFDVQGILAALNEAEGTTDDRWGGGNTVGGSPRLSGSKLSPREVEAIINAYLAAGQKPSPS